MKLIDATAEKSCDNCSAQEGRHYCLRHGQQVKNMDTVRCGDWQAHPLSRKPVSDGGFEKWEASLQPGERGRDLSGEIGT